MREAGRADRWMSSRAIRQSGRQTGGHSATITTTHTGPCAHTRNHWIHQRHHPGAPPAIACSDDTRTYWFNPASLVLGGELEVEYALVGALLGLAIYNGKSKRAVAGLPACLPACLLTYLPAYLLADLSAWGA